MDLHKVLLFLLATVVALTGQLRTLAEQLLHVKDLSLHFVWIFLHKFLPKRRFVLDRLPGHVALSIGDYYKDSDTNEASVSLPDLARIVFWCGRYGVDKISIYDWMGVVARPANTKILSDLVWDQITDKETGLDHLQFTVNGVNYDKADGNTKNGSQIRTLELVTLDWKAGRRAIVEACRSFGADVVSDRLDAKSTTTKQFGEKLIGYLDEQCAISAPDLLIEFGAGNVGDSTCGYPPLALRIVEIVQLARHRGLDELAFLDCLEKYCQRDRRFGK